MRSLLLFLLFPLVTVKSQERFEVKNLGFSILTPQNWLKMEDKEGLENIKKYDFTKKQLDELILSDREGISLVSFSKYDPKKYAGIIPTIKIRLLKTNSKSIQSLLKSVEMSNEETKKVLEDFKFSRKPSIIRISNNDAVSFSVSFKLKNAGNEYIINSESYYILKSGYYISINFIEQPDKEDNSKLFETLAESIILEN